LLVYARGRSDWHSGVAINIGYGHWRQSSFSTVLQSGSMALEIKCDCLQVCVRLVQRILRLLIDEQIHQGALIILLTGKLIQIPSAQSLWHLSRHSLAEQILMSCMQWTQTCTHWIVYFFNVVVIYSINSIRPEEVTNQLIQDCCRLSNSLNDQIIANFCILAINVCFSVDIFHQVSKLFKWVSYFLPKERVIVL
jgi:hypothetical protein